MGGVIVTLLVFSIGRIILGKDGIRDIEFAIANFPRVLLANISGTLICPAQYDLSEVKNKVWYILMLISVLGLLFVTFAFLIIDSPILKIFFVIFSFLLIIAFYLRSIDDTINSNNC